MSVASDETLACVRADPNQGPGSVRSKQGAMCKYLDPIG
jgi:hypothetical protein